MCDTSGLWGTAAAQLKAQVLRAEALTLQVLQQLFQTRPERLCPKQPVALRTHLNLEVLILRNGSGLAQVQLSEKQNNGPEEDI